MPQIGWSEILVIILVAILVIGPKDLPVVIRKFIQIKNGIKNYVNSFQKGIFRAIKPFQSPMNHDIM